jgi:CheY-like chemotaxis protein
VNSQNLKPCIVIVDDEEGLRELLHSIVSREFESSHEVLSAVDGLEAVDTFHREGKRIELFLLDLNMPRMGGNEFVQYLVNHSHVPVGTIILTGYGNPEVLKKFYEMGTENLIAFEFLTKPMEMKQLLEKISSALTHVRKRRLQAGTDEIKDIKSQLNEVEAKVDELVKRRPRNLLQDIGYDMLKTLVIGGAILMLLLSGLGRLIKELLKGIL